MELGCGAVGLRSAGDTPPLTKTSPEGEVGSRAHVLEILGRLWLAGVDVDWAALHAPERRRRVPLPTYPFERQRFWVDPLPPEPAKGAESSPAEWLYRPIWKTGFPAAVNGPGRERRWLVFLDSHGVGHRVVEELRAGGSDVVVVETGPGFGGAPASGYTLDPALARHYASLWEDLRRHQRLPERVLHLWGMESVAAAGPARERFRRASDLGFYSLLHLVATRPEGPLGLTVVATELHAVIGEEALAPEKAPSIPLCRVLAQEHHDLTCKLVDVEQPMEGPEPVADALLQELALEDAEPLVAIRRGQRWVQGFEPVPRAAQEREGVRVRPGGVYLITGGLGDVGFVLGIGLAHVQAKLVLTGRHGLLPRDRWAEWLDTHEPGEASAARIQKVQALEKLGAEVLVLKADAANVDEMRAAVAAARDRFGALHGVIHAAGELAPDTFQPAAELGREACERQFAPKVYGLMALEEALGGEALDFVLLTSSLSSILGGVGYAAYAGANAFMDAFAVRQNRRGKRVWVSVDWDQWEFAGRTPAGPARQAARDGTTLKPEEGLAVFARILHLSELDCVVVSRGPLDARLERWVRLTPPPAAASAATAGVRPRPPVSAPYAAPRDEAEGILAGIWQELLGIDRVGIHDNFLELGGHSLFAARVLSRVRSALGVALPLEAVFEAPTIAELASRVATLAWAKEPARRPEAAGERVEIEI
jgi:acyl transferase domain-containing protein/acyl carrier protein